MISLLIILDYAEIIAGTGILSELLTETATLSVENGKVVKHTLSPEQVASGQHDWDGVKTTLWGKNQDLVPTRIESEFKPPN